MPFQVKTGSFIVVVATLIEAIDLFDQFVDAGHTPVIRDMNGKEIEVDYLRSRLSQRLD